MKLNKFSSIFLLLLTSRFSIRCSIFIIQNNRTIFQATYLVLSCPPYYFGRRGSSSLGGCFLTGFINMPQYLNSYRVLCVFSIGLGFKLHPRQTSNLQLATCNLQPVTCNPVTCNLQPACLAETCGGGQLPPISTLSAQAWHPSVEPVRETFYTIPLGPLCPLFQGCFYGMLWPFLYQKCLFP